MTANELILAGLFFLAALFNASVGHGGGTTYQAIMALLGLSPTIARPMALALNVLVAGIGTFHFAKAGHFRWRYFLPFALVSIPAAWRGGNVKLPILLYKRALGAALLYSSIHLFFKGRQTQTTEQALTTSLTKSYWIIAPLIGGAIGFLSGALGIGGGIFLTPILVLSGWAAPKQAAAVSAPFILVNSLSGLLGNWSEQKSLPQNLWIYLLFAAIGGWIGSFVGSTKLSNRFLHFALAATLILAAVKLLAG